VLISTLDDAQLDAARIRKQEAIEARNLPTDARLRMTRMENLTEAPDGRHAPKTVHMKLPRGSAAWVCETQPAIRPRSSAA
jgi:hypothetical protein